MLKKAMLRGLFVVALLLAGRDAAKGQAEIGPGWNSPFTAYKFSSLSILAGGLLDFENGGLVVPNYPSTFSYDSPTNGLLDGEPAVVQAILDGYADGNPAWSGTSGIITDYTGSVDINDVVVGWADNNNLGLTSWGGVTGLSTTNHTLLIGGTLAGDPNLDGFNLTPVPEPACLALLGSALLGLGVVYLRRRRARTILRLLFAAALLASAVTLRANVISVAMVPVGDAGNVADPATGGVYGAVSYNYSIGEYDVTTGQYVAFLNSVATQSDTYGLYNSGMALGTVFPTVGISQTLVSGSYSYAVTGTAPGAANMPVFGVSWGDAARFCNWLDNGQPTSGTEATNTTETGAYALSGATSQTALMAVPSPAHSGSNAATYFLPSENEWYKAAYYSGGGTNSAYYVYPTESNTAPGNTLPDMGNNANFFLSNYTDPTNYLTPVGSFVDSPGPYGTYDMGGDVFQWNETEINGSSRGLRGGSWNNIEGNLASSARDNHTPTNGGNNGSIGFRVASSVAVPEPGSITLLLACAVAFGIWRLRRKA